MGELWGFGVLWGVGVLWFGGVLWVVLVGFFLFEILCIVGVFCWVRVFLFGEVVCSEVFLGFVNGGFVVLVLDVVLFRIEIVLLRIGIVLFRVGVFWFCMFVGEGVFIVFLFIGDGFLGVFMCIFGVFVGVFIVLDGVSVLVVILFVGDVFSKLVFFLGILGDGVRIWFVMVLEAGFGLFIEVGVFWLIFGVELIVGFDVFIVLIVCLVGLNLEIIGIGERATVVVVDCGGWLNFLDCVWVLVE